MLYFSKLSVQVSKHSTVENDCLVNKCVFLTVRYFLSGCPFITPAVIALHEAYKFIDHLLVLSVTAIQIYLVKFIWAQTKVALLLLICGCLFSCFLTLSLFLSLSEQGQGACVCSEQLKKQPSFHCCFLFPFKCHKIKAHLALSPLCSLVACGVSVIIFNHRVSTGSLINQLPNP